MKKTLVSLLLAVLVSLVIAGCGGSADKSDEQAMAVEEDRDEETGSAGNIEYLDAALKVNGGEYVHDDALDEDYFCLHMNYANNSTEAYELASSFVVVADQGNGYIDARQGSDYNTEEEANAWKEIEVGESADCDYYFPVDASQPVKIQVMNPDGMDTVLAEFEYSPE